MLADRFAVPLPGRLLGDRAVCALFLDAFAYDPDASSADRENTGLRRVIAVRQGCREGREPDAMAQKLGCTPAEIAMIADRLRAAGEDLTQEPLDADPEDAWLAGMQADLTDAGDHIV